MWAVLLYITAVVVYILLYWFHKPSGEVDQQSDVPAEQCRQRNDDSVDDSVSVSGSRSGSLRNRTKRRLSSLKRRKDLVESDILLSLGLPPEERGFEAFCDKFNTFEFVSSALVKAGFCSCDVVIGIDFTASNEWQGKRSFNKNCLHKLSGSRSPNPYQKVLQILGKTLSFVSTDHLIHSYGFGDTVTQDKNVFPLRSACADYLQIIEAYTEAARNVTLSGPTNFAPIINEAVRLCDVTCQYHVLILIVDGQVSAQCEEETVNAILQASNSPLSIIVIGVGDGPFGAMFEYDDGLPARKFDNLQFVNFHRTVTKSKHEAAFALHALMEIPDQYKAICQLGYLTRTH